MPPCAPRDRQRSDECPTSFPRRGFASRLPGVPESRECRSPSRFPRRSGQRRVWRYLSSAEWFGCRSHPRADLTVLSLRQAPPSCPVSIDWPPTQVYTRNHCGLPGHGAGASQQRRQGLVPISISRRKRGTQTARVKRAAGRIFRMQKHPEVGQLPSPSPSANLVGQSGSNHESSQFRFSKSQFLDFRSPAGDR